MGSFVNVPDNKLGALSDEERKVVEDRKNGVLPENNYLDVVSRELNDSVEKRSTRARKAQK